MITPNNTHLVDECDLILAKAEAARQWVEKYIHDSRRNDTVSKLKQIRRLTNRYKQAVPKRSSVAIFGESQVGKSYLVSTIAKAPEADVQQIIIPETGQRFAFKDIQPEGFGKETTGLVTRYTTQRYPTRPEYPLYLNLLTQADLVKILSVAYLNNITDSDYQPDPDELQHKLNELTSQIGLVNASDCQGFTEDEVFDIKEYLNYKSRTHRAFAKLTDLNFWERVGAIIAQIPYHRRWELFEFIWGRQSFFNDVFTVLSDALRQLSFSTAVSARIEALMPKEESIITVERYREILSNTQVPVRVVTAQGTEINIGKGTLSALTAELVLNMPDEVANHPERKLLQYADMLDFPGARSNLEMKEDNFRSEAREKFHELFVRGKVAFLFDRYNINSEISSLCLCIHNQQSNVRSLPKLVANWIESAVGKTPEERLARENRLTSLVGDKSIERVNPMFVVFTKINVELVGSQQDIPGDAHSHDYKWTNRYQKHFNEFLSNGSDYDWPERWSGTATSATPFKNIFPVRDPQFFRSTIYEGVKADGTGHEKRLKPDYQSIYDDLHTSFVKHPDVRRFSHNPDEGWDEFTGLNKSGVDNLLRYLTPACDPIIKYEQLLELIHRTRQELIKLLSEFHRGDTPEEEMAQAEKAAVQFDINFNLAQLRKNMMGLLLDQLVIPEEVCRSEYYQLVNGEIDLINQTDQNDRSTTNETSVTLADFVAGFGVEVTPVDDQSSLLTKLMTYTGYDRQALLDLLIQHQIQFEDAKPVAGKASHFSTRMIDLLTKRFSSLPDEFNIARLGLTKTLLEQISNQLKLNIERVSLCDRLVDLVKDEIADYHPTDNQNFDLVAKLTYGLLNQFVSTAGYRFVESDKRPVLPGNSGARAFTPPAGRTPPRKEILQLNLSDNQVPGHAHYVNWRLGLKDSFVANVLYSRNYADKDIARAYEELATIYKSVLN